MTFFSKSKRTKTVVSAVFLSLVPAFLAAQNAWTKWAFRADVDGFLTKKAAVSIENRFSKVGGLELEGQFRWHYRPEKNAQYFEGVWATEWADERIDSVLYPGASLVNAPERRYIGTGRPLPQSPPAKPVFSATGRLGYRFRFKTRSGRGEWAVEPTFAVAAHRFWEVEDRFDGPSKLVFVTKSEIPYTGYFLIRTEQRYFRQERRMKLKTTVIPGLFYQIGRTERFSRRLFVEARAGGGLNFSPSALEKAPAPSGQFYADFSIKIGCFLDKKMADLPPKKTWKKPKPRTFETL